MTGEAATAAAPLLPGQRLGTFELLGLVSRGGMGEIWLGRTRDSETLFAVKTLLPNLVDAPKMRLMFVEETRIAAQLVHPNVVRVVDVGEPLPVPYYAMEWVDGAPLDDLFAAASAMAKTVKVDGSSNSRMSAASFVRARERELESARDSGSMRDGDATGRLPMGVLVHIVHEAAMGLHAAHELRDDDGRLRDVVHRDVSPSNVLVGRDGVSKITDFGIARARGRLAKTTTGGFRGKLAYVSPEQALARDVDRRADVWGLGAVLYEGLAGHPPYQGRDEASIIAQLVTGPPQFVFNVDVPRQLVAVLRRAMAHAPAARYPTAEAFARDLAAARDALGLAVTPADVAAEVEARVGASLRARTERLLRGSGSNRQQTAQSAPRPSWRTLAAVAVAAVAVGGVAVAGVLARSAPRTFTMTSTVGGTHVSKVVTLGDAPLLGTASASPSAEATDAGAPPVEAVAPQATASARAATVATAPALKADGGTRTRGHGTREPVKRDPAPKPPRPAEPGSHVDPDDPGW